MAVQLVRRSFTVEEYHRMAQAGILSEDDRVVKKGTGHLLGPHCLISQGSVLDSSGAGA
jgi:hypothetical protein